MSTTLSSLTWNLEPKHQSNERYIFVAGGKSHTGSNWMCLYLPTGGDFRTSSDRRRTIYSHIT
jgi:hypothetical protein